MIRIVPGLFLLATLVACGQNGGNLELPAPQEAAVSPPQGDFVQNRSLVRTVSLNVLSRDTAGMARRVQDLVVSVGGYVEDLNSTARTGGPEYILRLRVPSDQLDSVVDQVKGFADEVDSETRTTEDVTATVVDLDARVRALELTEQQLEELLAESRSAGRDAEGIMSIFRELSSIRERRESLEGQIASLGDRVSLAKIDLRISRHPSVRSFDIDWDLGLTVSNAFQALLFSLRLLASMAINILIVVVPVLGLLVVPVILVVNAVRRHRRRQK